MPTIATRNARVQYWKTGTGPAVILVQGAGVIGEGWRPQIDALKGHYTVIWIDGPDHDTDQQRGRDAEVDACLADLGYTSLRFRHDERDAWIGILRAHPSTFGQVR